MGVVDMVMMQGSGRVTAECEWCHAVPFGPGGSRTWPDDATAVRALTHVHGWQVTDRGVICPGCAAQQSCQSSGHTFGEWASMPDTDLVVRRCRACDARDHAPAYVLSPIGRHVA
ncbi:MAG: hypothetical protein V9F82_10665 [Dermatophilaceae bacterium]